MMMVATAVLSVWSCASYQSRQTAIANVIQRRAASSAGRALRWGEQRPQAAVRPEGLCRVRRRQPGSGPRARTRNRRAIDENSAPTR